MESTRTLPREPWRGSMICGNQLAYGLPGSRFCAERKADGLPMCEACFDDTMEEYGHVVMAPGNAVGGSQWAVRLLWEGEDPDVPVEASADELALYAPLLTGGAQ